MNKTETFTAWWDIHLRHAKGEMLSPEEIRIYQDELSRRDQEEALEIGELHELKSLRDQARQVREVNTELKERVARLDREIDAIEKTLSSVTRKALGVAG